MVERLLQTPETLEELRRNFQILAREFNKYENIEEAVRQGAEWGYITGDITDQSDLQDVLVETTRDLDDVQDVSPSDDQVPRWNESESRYEPSDTSDTTYDAGTGLELDDTTFSTNDSEIVHDNLSGYESDEHIDWTDSQTEDIHSDNYTDTQLSDSEVISIIDGDSSHGSDASHDYFSGSHNDLSDVDSGDHHSRYTDSEAEDAINNDSDHGSTASHDYTDDYEVYGLIPYQSSAPDTGDERVWIDSDTDEIKVYDDDSSSWIVVGSTYSDSEAIDAVRADDDHATETSHDFGTF